MGLIGLTQMGIQVCTEMAGLPHASVEIMLSLVNTNISFDFRHPGGPACRCMFNEFGASRSPPVALTPPMGWNSYDARLLTTAANLVLEPIHDRMPVVVLREERFSPGE
jgi:hypothetical protein